MSQTYDEDVLEWSEHQARLLRQLAGGHAWPSSREVPHWRAEARGFKGDAAEAVTPSMRARIDMPGLYRRALSRLPESIDDQPPLPVPEACPVTLEDVFGLPASLVGLE